MAYTPGGPLKRWMGIDYGERRIGIAISDPSGMVAAPAGFVLRRPEKRPPVQALIARAGELGATAFVLGLPLDDDGNETPRATEVRWLADELSRRTGLPASFIDERYTTAAALRAIREMGGSTRGRRGDVDALAATFLLQHALDRTT